MDNEERVRQAAEEAAGDARPYPEIPTWGSLIVRTEELANARITPKCVVEHYIYADVALFAGPGGTGKTTLAVWESVHIVLGRPLYGLQVCLPGAVMFITAEDRRELLVARLREVMAQMDLSDQDRATVRAGFRIWDVTGSVCRLAELDARGNVVLTGLADAIVERFRDPHPVMVVFDPCISFGAGERLTNDNEHALILASRRIVRGLDCCVRLICHTGKQVARDGVIDQYAARGGSALADGARMVTVLRSWDPDTDAASDKLIPPIGFRLGAGETGMVLVRAKLSYGPPQPRIWLKRRGYGVEHSVASRPDPEAEAKARADQIERYLISELASGRRHTRTTLDDTGIMPRAKLRAALSSLIASGRVISAALPEGLQHGGRKDYLHPVKATPPGVEPERGGVDQKSTPTPPDPETPSTPPPPYREKNGGGVEAAVFIPTDLSPRRRGMAG